MESRASINKQGMREIGDAALPGGHRALQRRRGMGEAPQDAQHGEYEYGDANPLMPCVVLKFEWGKPGIPVITQPREKPQIMSAAISQCNAIAGAVYSFSWPASLCITPPTTPPQTS